MTPSDAPTSDAEPFDADAFERNCAYAEAMMRRWIADGHAGEIAAIRDQRVIAFSPAHDTLMAELRRRGVTSRNTLLVRVSPPAETRGVAKLRSPRRITPAH